MSSDSQSLDAYHGAEYLLKPEELIIEKFKGEVRVSQAKRRDNLFQEKDMSSVNTQR